MPMALHISTALHYMAQWKLKICSYLSKNYDALFKDKNLDLVEQEVMHSSLSTHGKTRRQ